MLTLGSRKCTGRSCACTSVICSSETLPKGASSYSSSAARACERRRLAALTPARATALTNSRLCMAREAPGLHGEAHAERHEERIAQRGDDQEDRLQGMALDQDGLGAQRIDEMREQSGGGDQREVEARERRAGQGAQHSERRGEPDHVLRA